MSDVDLCDDCGRPIYDYLDVEEQDRVDTNEEHDKYCCSEKGHPDPMCLQIRMNKLEQHKRAADVLIEKALIKCGVEGCMQFAAKFGVTVSMLRCDEHKNVKLYPSDGLVDLNYAEELRAYLTAKEKND